MKKAIIISSLLVLVCAGSSFAQQPKLAGGLGFYQPGFQFFTPTDLNEFLPSILPEMNFQSFYDAGAGYVVMKNIMIGFEGGDYRGGSFTSGGIKADLSGEFASVKVGYVVLQKPRFILYPLIGYSTNTLNLYIHGADLTRSFEDITSNPEIATTLKYSNQTASLSVGGQFFPLSKQSDGLKAGLAIGFEAGYQLPPFWHGEWTYDNGPVADGPLFDLSGFYFKLSVGGGGLSALQQ